MEQNELLTDIQYLKGVGPKRAALFRNELGIETVDDLIHLFPTRYVDRSRVMRISDISADSPFVQFRGKVVSTNVSDKGKRLEVQVSDGSGEMLLVFFRGLKYTKERLVQGAEFLFYGKPTLFNGRLNIVHPEIDAPPSSSEALPQGVMTGVYPSTEKLRSSGITGKVMNKMMASALNLALPWVEEPLPEYIMKEKGLVGVHYALRNIHFPSDPKALEKASRRLKWDELFFLQLSLLKHRFIRSRNEKGFLMPKEIWDFDTRDNWDPSWLSLQEVKEDKDNGMSAALAWTPYVLIALILVITRLPYLPVKAWLNSHCIVTINNILGVQGSSWAWKVANNPGILPFLVIVLLTFIIHKVDGPTIKEIFKDTWHQVTGAFVALIFGCAMVAIYRNTTTMANLPASLMAIQESLGATSTPSMLLVMAKALADLFAGAYVIVAPLIGVLGAFMSGSNTVSNTLFAALQFETASLIGMSPVIICAMQNIGGAAGNMICVNNVVAACATTGTLGNEGKIIKTNIVPCLIYCFITIIVLGLICITILHLDPLNMAALAAAA